MKIVPEISLRHDLQYFLFISTPTIDIEPVLVRDIKIQQALSEKGSACCLFLSGGEEQGKGTRSADGRLCGLGITL